MSRLIRHAVPLHVAPLRAMGCNRGCLMRHAALLLHHQVRIMTGITSRSGLRKGRVADGGRGGRSRVYAGIE